MQMYSVVQRLRELDSKNPNVVQESLDECGPMGMVGQQKAPASASININAGSPEELEGMLGALMKLAGVNKVTDKDMGNEKPGAVLTAQPVSGVGPAKADQDVDGMDSMRKVIDKMHGSEDEADEGLDSSLGNMAPGAAIGAALGGPVGAGIGAGITGMAGNSTDKMSDLLGKMPKEEEEADESTDVLQNIVPEEEEEADESWDNTPDDPRKPPPFDADEYSNHENPPGAGHGRRTTQPNANPTAFESLWQEYKTYIENA